MDLNISRTDKEVLEAFDNGYPEFRWFIRKYFGQSKIDAIEELRKKGKARALVNLLTDVWYHLPDNKFNIIENPTGWREFLNVIED